MHDCLSSCSSIQEFPWVNRFSSDSQAEAPRLKSGTTHKSPGLLAHHMLRVMTCDIFTHEGQAAVKLRPRVAPLQEVKARSALNGACRINDTGINRKLSGQVPNTNWERAHTRLT
jgi:hypothetical protein